MKRYLNLFLTVLKIGLFTFGGGYAMISLIREEVLTNGWLTEAELLNMIAVSESTPGPIAVNMAGSSQGGVLGSLLATLGVVLLSFIIILLIAALIRNFLKYKGVQAFLDGIRPCVVGLILTTAVTLFLSTILRIQNIGSDFSVDIKGLAILGLLFAVDFISKKLLQKKLSPIIMIVLSAGLGMILYL